jgi:cell wall-associated NlpC family hydrolase
MEQFKVSDLRPTSQQIIYDYAKSLLGLPYIWGGDDAIKGYDCSGLVIEILTAAGIFPRYFDTTAKGIFKELKIKGSETLNIPSFGAVMFFGKNVDTISHTAFCLNSDLYMEAGAGDSTTITTQDAIKKNAFVRIRPTNFRSDVIAVLKPKYSWG